MKNTDFSISLKAEMDDNINRMQKYYNFLINEESYDSRLFFLTFSNYQVINDIINYFPGNYKEIRKHILTKTAKYIKENRIFSDYIVNFDDDSDSYELFIENIKGEKLVNVLLADKKTHFIKNTDILMIEVQMTEAENEIKKIDNEITQIKSLFNEDNISDVSEYAKKMFFPKSYSKKLDKKLKTLYEHHKEVQNKIDAMISQLNIYTNSDRYREQKKISDAINELFAIKK